MHDTTLTINLQALSDNYHFLCNKVAPASLSAVVKANAYGLGVEHIAPRLAQEGCTSFFVANLEEAITLRTLLPTALIGVFHGIRPSQHADFVAHKLIPVLNNWEEIDGWLAYGNQLQKKLPAYIHIDTGMNRLGISFYDPRLSELPNLLKLFDCRAIISHLACASDPSHPLNKQQLARMHSLKKHHPQATISFANSYGTFLGDEYHFNYVRTGCMLYGVSGIFDPTQPDIRKNNPIKEVISLTSHIIQTRVIDSIQTVGYGATQELPKGSVIATIPVGYADGYLRSLTGNAQLYINNHAVPVIGIISMDSMMVDVTHLPPELQTIGTEVELIGSHISVDMLAHNANTIGYEILTQLGQRFKRVYKG